MNKDTSVTEKATKRIKEVGDFSQILGWWHVFAAIVVLIDKDGLLGFLDYSYSDMAFNIVLGIIFIILGSRIKKGISKSTKKYIWIILILSGIFSFVNIVVSNGKPSITLLLFAFSVYALTQLKYIKIFAAEPDYKIWGKRWILVGLIFALIIATGLILDLNKYGYLINEESFPKTDKNRNNSEQIGNLYSNKIYNFKIAFPEGWEQKPGNRLSILQKALNGGNSINVGVQEFPPEFKDLEINIRDLGLEKEYFKEIQNNFPDAELIDSGFTKIDNTEAFYIEYTANYGPVLMHNKQWQIAHDNAVYTISAAAYEDAYLELEEEFALSVGSFSFED